MRVKPCALVLDDDPIFRKMLEVVMTRLGLTVKTVETAPEFWEAMVAVQPDLLLVDLQLGEVNGLTLIEELRVKQGNKVPIIVISGNHDQEVVSHALEIGANEYVLKPFDKALLANKLRQFVRTDELDEQEKLLKVLDGKGQEAKVSSRLRVQSVDELGMKLSSPHLVTKGTLVRLSGPWVATVTGSPKDCVLWVTSTALNSADGRYEIYAEFEGTDVALLQAVRRWLISQRKEAA